MKLLHRKNSKAKRLRLDIPVLLPDMPDEADACVGRLIGELTGRNGIDQVHVLPAAADQPAKLCIHYRPEVLSLGRIKEIATGAGARVTERFGHILWETGGLSNERRARTVTEHLQRMKGVMEAVATIAGPVRIEFDRTLTSEQAIRKVLGDLSVDVRSPPGEALGTQMAGENTDGHEHGGLFGENTELIFAVVCGVLLAAAFLASFATTFPSWVSLTLYICAYGFGGYYLLRDAIASIRLGRLEIDVLMLVAAGGAAALDKWAEGALLLFLFSIGHSLEHYAMGRARRAIEALAKLAPPTAEVRRKGKVTEVGVTDLVVGDIIVIRPNTRIPADGFVILGAS
ncbi:MAG: heavy metal translocating P-type ATPase, partial [Devosia sp.]